MSLETNIPSGKNYIYFAVFAVNLLTFSSGGCWSWTSPIIPKLTSLDPQINPLPRPTTSFENSWIASIMNLGAVVGPLAGGVCSEKFGKKKTLLLLGLPIVMSHVLSALAVNVHFFLVARFLIGVGAGTVFGVVPGYVGDIAEDKNRGTLGSVLGIFNCAGILFMYVVGPFLSVRAFSLVNLIAPLTFYVFFGFFATESPYDLVKQGKRDEAEASLAKLRNKQPVDIQKELAYIVEAVEASAGQNIGFLTLFKSKSLTKGLIISNGLMFFQQFSGICAVLGYMQNVFDMTGSSIPSTYSAMLIGFVQLVANFVSGQLVEKAGRKVLLFVSHIFSMASLMSLGTYFYMMTLGIDVTEISWLPVASLILYIIAFNLGLANMPWIILAELFPSNVKAIASTVTSFVCFSFSFLITMCFPYLSEAIGMPGTFWIFGTVLLVGFIFCIMIVPETKGKSSQEIQNILEGIEK